ncbi:MAG: 50S ribosomal protein L17 [Acidobacteriota bacterium]
MRHRVAGRKLGRTTAHRQAMLRNLATALFAHERITTTLMKAKEVRSFAEKLITVSRRDTLAARRRVARDIREKAILKKLFETLAPRYADRPGGYTRIFHLGFRPGDTADMAMVELVGAAPGEAGGDKAKKKPASEQTPEKLLAGTGPTSTDETAGESHEATQPAPEQKGT